jgi:xanthine dehydrogenase YagR molybdenum-binding subunit
VTKHVAAFDIGRVINAKTARSQALGGITMGIGMALLEHTVYDHKHGRPITNNLADYAIPVNADVPNIDVIFVEYPDLIISPLGARGLGEIGITGVAPAIANAIFHATGIRVRGLPITPDKLLHSLL